MCVCVCVCVCVCARACVCTCPLCFEKQTLMHVLNSCTVALQQRCYNHAAMLQVIADFVRAHVPHGYSIVADLPSEEYIKPHFMVSDLRPDVIMWSAGSKVAYLLGLTVCFDTNVSVATERKTTKYLELVAATTSTSAYKCCLCTIQVGS